MDDLIAPNNENNPDIGILYNIETKNIFNTEDKKSDIDFETTKKKNGEFDETYVCKLKDENEIIKYMNNFFITIKGSKIVYCELSYNADGRIKNICYRNKKEMESRLDECLIKTTYQKTKMFDIWNKSLEKRKAKAIDYIPYSINKPIIDENTLNIFSGFKSKIREDRADLDYSKISPILNHIKEVWCDNKDNIYEYVINWLAQLFQYPEKKLGICLVLKSDRQGAGKSMIVDFIQDFVLGEDYCRTVSNIDRIFERFNGMSERVLLTCCEEIGSRGGMYKMSDQLKELITGTKKTVEKKYMEASQMRDYQRYIFCSNNDWIVRVEESDRRFMCLEVSNIYVGNSEYFKNLVNNCFNPECGELFLNYMLKKDLSNVDLRNIPMTEWKRSLMSKNLDIVLQSLIKYVSKQGDEDETRHHIKDIYEYYEKIDTKKIYKSMQSYNNQLKKYLDGIECKKDVKKDGVNRSGYVGITKEQIREKIRKYLKDPEYEFKEDEIEEEPVCIIEESEEE
jgi:hypothetical protein